MALTASDFAQQMIAQARVLDPSFSGEIGTPERKIIDTVAQSLADNQIDLTGLAGALDIDSKFGTNLDRFTALFGMQRQQAAAATGYVVFSRNTPATTQIVIPADTVLQNNTADIEGSRITQYTATASGSIAVGQTASGAVPIQSVVTGTAGNTGANTITQMVIPNGQGSVVPGVTSVTNPNALTNGLDVEDDNSFKVRFKNTWARNLSGTVDQFLALALAGTFTSKAVALGDQSRFQEYIQVPDYDDAGYLNGVQNSLQNTYGVQNQWTSALSTIPYAKQIYSDTQVFVSNGQQGATQTYFTPDVDYTFNAVGVNKGDVLRNLGFVPTKPLPISKVAVVTYSVGVQTLPESTITVQANGTIAFTGAGVLNFGGFLVAYTGKTSNTFTGCTATGSGTLPSGTPILQAAVTFDHPNFTFINVFNPATPTTIDGLQALSPADIVLSEFSYVSVSSRNDLEHNVTNAVDVYVDGSNDLQTSCIVLPNVVQGHPGSPVLAFNTNSNSPWYYENFRRDGDPTKRPQLFNLITPLFQAPLESLPSSISLNSVNFVLGVDYWLVHEIGDLGGSLRARDGIEWNRNSSPGNNIVTASMAGNIPLEVDNYVYDANIVALQASMEAADLVGFDILVHKTQQRYLKLDVTIMYAPHSTFTVVNAAIATAVQAFFDRQYFGATIQLSDLLEAIHEVSGVDNVRWSNDLPLIPNLIRVMETDIGGNPLHGVSVDRWLQGTGSVVEQQTLYVVGNPSGLTNNVTDSFKLTWTDGIIPGGSMTTAAIPFWHFGGDLALVTAADIQSAITAVAPGSGIYHGITVTEDTRPTADVDQPIRSFTLTYGAVGTPVIPTVTNSVTSSAYTYDADFFLLDSELPSLPQGQITGDTLPGLIIRNRAQNTFVRPGLG